MLCLILVCSFPVGAVSATDDSAMVYVNNISSLQTTCEANQNVSIRLTSDIVAAEDLVLCDGEQVTNIDIDLNGQTIYFESGKNLEVNATTSLTLTSSQPGAAVVFLYDPDDGFPGGVINSGFFVLDGSITFNARNAVTGSNLTPAGRSAGYTLIHVCGVPQDSIAAFVMNSGTLDATGNYTHAVVCDWGQVIVNGGIIRNSCNEDVAAAELGSAIANFGGNVRFTGGEIHASGDDCITVSNYDMFTPSGTPALMGEYTPAPVRDTFGMTGGLISVEGVNAVALAAERNCTVIGGTIVASGENSTGILYYYAGGRIGESPNVTLIGGMISGEGHALADKRGQPTYYKNIAAEPVFVDSTTKELVPGYKDVAFNASYAQDFYELVYEGIITGYPGGSFNPRGAITRAEFMTLLARYVKEDLSQYENMKLPFSDTGASEWYTLPIAWGAANNLINGYVNGSFGINDSITREQMITVLYRHAMSVGIVAEPYAENSLNEYSDAADISEWALPAVQWAVGTGLVQGKNDMQLSPQGLAIRAETAVILMRLREATG